MSTFKNKIHQRKFQLACESIKISLNMMMKIDDWMEKKIDEEFKNENNSNLNFMMESLRDDCVEIQRGSDLFLKIKIFLQIIILVSKYLTEDIENSVETKRIYLIKVKTMVDRIISKMYARSSNMLKKMKINSEFGNKKLKTMDSDHSYHKYSVSTVSSERCEDENNLVI